MYSVSPLSNLESREPLWAGLERKSATLDRFFAEALPPRWRRAVKAVCVDIWGPYTQNLRAHLPKARIVYKFHVLKHANAAVDETRRVEFFRKGGSRLGLVRGKRWLLLTRWHHLKAEGWQTLRELFAVNRRLVKAYQLRGLERLWTYTYEGGGAALPRHLDPGPPVATAPGVPAVRRPPPAAPGGDLGLLQCQGALRGRGGH